MKKIFSIYTLGVVGLLLSINSCQKPALDGSPSEGSARQELQNPFVISEELEDKSVINNVEVREGILHFKNAIIFNNIREQLSVAKNEEAKAKILNAPGFEPLSKAFYNALSDSTKTAKIDELIASNADILEKKNGHVQRKGALAFEDVINRVGLVFIGKTLYRFTGDKEIIVSDGDTKKAILADQPGYKDATVKVFQTLISSLSTSSPNGRPSTVCSSGMSGVRWNSDGKRAIDYLVQFQQYTTLTSGTVGDPNSRYSIVHYTYNLGIPHKVSPAFSQNYSSYNTDNHFFPNYKLSYASKFSNYTPVDVLVTSGSELFNYNSSISTNITLNYLNNLTESDAVSYTQGITLSFTGGIEAFGNTTSQYGYYYSTGVPTPIYIKCN